MRRLIIFVLLSCCPAVRRWPSPAAGAPPVLAAARRIRRYRRSLHNRDIRPLFGNPIAVGAIGTQGLTGSQIPPFLVVWVTKSATKLTALLGKLQGLRSAGTHDGPKLYAGGGVAVAAAGPTLILSRSTSDLETALDRHAHQQGFSSADYARATTGIGPSGAVEMFGDLANVLAAPSAAKARRVPWVAAIRGYGVSIGSSPAGVTIQ